MIRLLMYAFFGWLVYEKFFKKQSNFLEDNILIMPDINENLLSQPSQKFPFKRSLDPRRDGVNQPWYNGGNSFKGFITDVKELSGFDVTSDRTDSYDTKSFWNELNNRYGVH